MELATPLTIYWDLPTVPADPAVVTRICSDIVDCRPLMLQLYDPALGMGASTRAILSHFKGTPVSLSLTLLPTAFAALSADLSLVRGVKELLIQFDSQKDLVASTIKGSSCPPPMGVTFRVSGRNWRELPLVVESCREGGIKRLVLPMQRLYTGEPPFYLTRPEQEELASALAAIGGGGGMNLTIHDPFLWRAFNPGVPFPQGGCQAANTMLAISPDGGVYPCPTLPIRIGDMGEMSLKSIAGSPVKKDLRRRLLEYPAACRTCPEVAECKGGCRGRAFARHGSLDGIDAACR